MEQKKFPYEIKKLEKSINEKVIKDYTGNFLKDILIFIISILFCERILHILTQKPVHKVIGSENLDPNLKLNFKLDFIFLTSVKVILMVLCPSDRAIGVCLNTLLVLPMSTTTSNAGRPMFLFAPTQDRARHGCRKWFG